MKAMILAAGLGVRLRPLTGAIPKALIPLWGRPLLHYQIQKALAWGASSIVINTHYLAEQIDEYLKTHKYPAPIHISHEFPVVLGTGGGLRHARPLLEPGPVLVLNGDALFGSDLIPLVHEHREKKALATMAVRASPGEQYSPVFRDPNGRLLSLPGMARPAGAAEQVMFAGLHVIELRLLDYLSPREVAPCIVRDAYLPALHSGALVHTVRHDGYWADLGTARHYHQAYLDPLAGRGPLSELIHDYLEPVAGVRVHPTAKVAAAAAFQPPVVVDAGAEIGAGATLGPETVIAPRARVGAGASLIQCLVGPGAVVPENTLGEGLVFAPDGSAELK